MATSKNNQKLNRGALILVGGASQRMGQAKWKLLVENESFLEIQIRIAATVTNEVAISAQLGQLDQETFATPPGVHSEIVPDQNLNCGPMEGIRAGLKHLHQRGREWAFVSAVDSPGIRGAVIERLFDAAQGFQMAVPVSGSRIFGLTAVYRTDLYLAIETLVNERKLKVSGLGKHFKTNFIPIDEFKSIDPELASFDNINDAQQYREIEANRFRQPD